MFYNCLQKKGKTQRSQRNIVRRPGGLGCPTAERSASLVSSRSGPQGHREELVLWVNNIGHLLFKRYFVTSTMQMK